MALRYIGSVSRPYESHGRLFVGDVPSYVGQLPAGTTVHIGYSTSFARPYTLLSAVAANRGLIVELASVSTPEAVRDLKNMGLYVEEEIVRTHGHVQYFDDELIGCMMVDVDTGADLGPIADIWRMPAGDLWVMNYRGKEIPVPAVDEYVRRVDLHQQRVEIFVMPGLLELAEGTENDERDDDE